MAFNRTDAEFEQYYTSNLFQTLQELEVPRKAARKDLIECIVLTATMFACIGGIFVFGTWIPVVPGALVIYFMVSQFKKYATSSAEYKNAFKMTVIKPMIAFVEPSLAYQPYQMISQSDYYQSGVFTTRVDRYSGGDLVSGKIGETSLRFSEVHAEEKRKTTDSKGRTQTHWVTIFKGILFIADFNKHFNSRTLVLPDNSVMQFFGSIFGRPDNLVKLEDPEFEKLFRVYGDQIEARYILSPSLMERMKNFSNKTNRPLHFAYINSSVYIFIGINEELFEAKVFSSGIKFGYLKRYFDYLQLSISIVDELNLNTRIWSKQ